MEYITSTDNILVLLLHSNLILKPSLPDEFSIRLNDTSEVAYWTTLYTYALCSKNEPTMAQFLLHNVYIGLPCGVARWT